MNRSWRERICIYGTADDPVDRVGMVGPGHYVRATPTISWSWNLEGAPVGDSWYDARRTVHTTVQQKPA